MSKFGSLVKSHPLVIVDFYADWCGPCKAQAPILKELKSEVGDLVKVVKIDTEKNQKLSAELGIRSIPTMMLYRYGKKVWQQSGVAQKEQLKKLLKQYS